MAGLTLKGWGRVGEPEIRHVSGSGAMTWWEGHSYLSEVESLHKPASVCSFIQQIFTEKLLCSRH